jgi:CheY-like chemotaxis protein
MLVVEDDTASATFTDRRCSPLVMRWSQWRMGSMRSGVSKGDARAVVVLDLGLPRLNGHDVQRELKATPATARIPVIVITGTDITDVDRQRFECVLTKPITPRALVEAVHKCLTNWRG